LAHEVFSPWNIFGLSQVDALDNRHCPLIMQHAPPQGWAQVLPAPRNSPFALMHTPGSMDVWHCPSGKQHAPKQVFDWQGVPTPRNTPLDAVQVPRLVTVQVKLGRQQAPLQTPAVQLG
jgi:hypothetical protein